MNKLFIKDLVASKSEHIQLKKATIKQTDSIGVTESASKSIKYDNTDDLENGVITRKFAANTYNWLDSHGDVHIDGVFTKSINENKNILHLHDHIFTLESKVGSIKSIDEVSISWSDLGVDKEGYTTVLLPTSEIKKGYNPKIYNQYLNKEIQQHSVGMQYVDMFLCVNDADYEDEYKAWIKYSPKVGNIEKAISQGYFWAITTAKLIEISCVIAGSNELTGTFEPSTEPSKDTQDDTQLYKYLVENFKLK